MFVYKPDYEQAQQRINAFWNHEETDRPAVFITHQKQNATPFAKKQHKAHEDYWLDMEYRVAEAERRIRNTAYLAESMPVFYPNMGPSILSAFAGCPHTFGADTAWADPCLFNWETETAIIDPNHPLAKKLKDFTKLALETAKGKFIVGLTDLHPGGDHLAALRGSETLAIDLMEYPEQVKAKLTTSYDEYYALFDYYVAMLKNAGMPITTWLPLTSDTNMYIPSNDFSCMISTAMFEEFFLPGIIAECRHYDKSIYHLDGPDALRHLPSLLEIPELNAIQWMPGAGNDMCVSWFNVFKEILAAGKSVFVYPQNINDLKLLMENFPAHGLCLQIWSMSNQDEAEAVLKLINKWNTKR